MIVVTLFFNKFPVEKPTSCRLKSRYVANSMLETQEYTINRINSFGHLIITQNKDITQF